MKVITEEKVYESFDEPILLILTPEEKELIKNMSENDNRFCSYPENIDEKEIKKWLRDKE